MHFLITFIITFLVVWVIIILASKKLNEIEASDGVDKIIENEELTEVVAEKIEEYRKKKGKEEFEKNKEVIEKFEDN
jgi:hypothetical protein